MKKVALWSALVGIPLLCLLVFIGLRMAAVHEVELPPSPAVPPQLEAHSAIFKKGVVKVTDKVYVAIGYGLANSIMIVGDDGIIIVDTMTTNQEATQVLAQFRRITDKPVKAIIYTHHHADHVFGAQIFAQGASPAIYAHASTEALVMHLITELRPIIGIRSRRMFGTALPQAQVVNDGIGPWLGIKPGSTYGFLPPAKTFQDQMEVKVAGVRLKLIHAPGETADQIYVWLPDEKVLLPGDNFYWTFPNLYTIRGTAFRSLKDWYRSLDIARDLAPKYLVPSHTRPLSGVKEIHQILTNYRDAIQYVHDQALRGMNMGLTPDELAETIKLPPHLAAAPYLQPFYGEVDWSVRSMFAGNLGWFSGDSADLHPQTRRARAAMMADLAGGTDKLLARARGYMAKGQAQAALELSGYLIRLDPSNRAARELRVQALGVLAGKEQNPNARHYYLSEALEISRGEVLQGKTEPTPQTLQKFPLEDIFQSLAVNLNPKAAAKVDQKVGMLFPDAGRAFLIHVRFGVAEIREMKPSALRAMDLSVLVQADSRVWREMLAGLRSPLTALASFDYPKGGALAFGGFMRLFAKGKMKLACEPLSVLK